MMLQSEVRKVDARDVRTGVHDGSPLPFEKGGNVGIGALT